MLLWIYLNFKFPPCILDCRLFMCILAWGRPAFSHNPKSVKIQERFHWIAFPQSPPYPLFITFFPSPGKYVPAIAVNLLKSHDSFGSHNSQSLFLCLLGRVVLRFAQSRHAGLILEIFLYSFHINCSLFNHATIRNSTSMKDFRGTCFFVANEIKISLNESLARICLKSEKAKLLRPLTLCRCSGMLSQ